MSYEYEETLEEAYAWIKEEVWPETAQEVNSNDSSSFGWYDTYSSCWWIGSEVH